MTRTAGRHCSSLCVMHHRRNERSNASLLPETDVISIRSFDHHLIRSLSLDELLPVTNKIALSDIVAQDED